mgnify:CR=1 FL=1
MKLKKLTALFLSVLMLLSVLPAALAEDATPQYGGMLTVLAMESNSMFPALSSTTSNRFNFSPAVEALGRRNAETGDTEPWLAESFTVDADALTLTIKLREGIKFSDGSNFNADAVIWNFDKLVEYGKASEICSPESYEKTDDYTVVLHYTAWNNTWVDILGECYIYCPAAFEANGEEWATLHAVGTGAFIQSEYVQDSHITYVRNDNYWRAGEPYLDSIKLLYINDSMTQYASFINKELDVLRNPNSSNIKQLLSLGYENAASDAPNLAGITYMMFCSGDEKSPFYDLRVRQAVMYAVDWEAMAEGIYDGLGASTPVFAVPGAWSYDDTLSVYPYDMEKALSLLSEAGYPNGFSTTISINEGNAANLQCAIILQAYLLAGGDCPEMNSGASRHSGGIPHAPVRGSWRTPASVPEISDWSEIPPDYTWCPPDFPAAAAPLPTGGDRCGGLSAPPASAVRTAWCPCRGKPAPQWAYSPHTPERRPCRSRAAVHVLPRSVPDRIPHTPPCSWDS